MKKKFVDHGAAVKAAFDGAMYNHFGKKYFQIKLRNLHVEHSDDWNFIRGLPCPDDVRMELFSTATMEKEEPEGSSAPVRSCRDNIF